MMAVHAICDGPDCSTDIHGSEGYEVMHGDNVVIQDQVAMLSTGTVEGVYCSPTCIKKAIEQGQMGDEQ